tara:strand:- start:1046 stop:1327 length:282 start_codon:yes stop_codon:yes gene_type:complete
MKVKRTFFNSRNNRLYGQYSDTNNYLFIILFDSRAELSFILRDLKKNDTIESYIYKKLQDSFGNIAEVEISKITSGEYNLLKQMHVPSVTKVC